MCGPCRRSPAHRPAGLGRRRRTPRVATSRCTTTSTLSSGRPTRSENEIWTYSRPNVSPTTTPTTPAGSGTSPPQPRSRHTDDHQPQPPLRHHARVLPGRTLVDLVRRPEPTTSDPPPRSPMTRSPSEARHALGLRWPGRSPRPGGWPGGCRSCRSRPRPGACSRAARPRRPGTRPGHGSGGCSPRARRCGPAAPAPAP